MNQKKQQGVVIFPSRGSRDWYDPTPQELAELDALREGEADGNKN